MILIADSGSFKTNWRILKADGQVMDFNTIGLNPYFTGSEEFQKEIKAHFPEEIRFEDISAVYFYGAGCGSPEKGKIIEEALKEVFPEAFVEVHTDLLAAARACFGSHEGLVVILGTGSNHGDYDGENIVQSFPSLGYILGDEGSGAQLGKSLITSFLLGELPKPLHDSFLHQYKLTREEILDHLYSKPRPNRFLASFVPFLWYYRQEPFISQMVKTSFRKLVNTHLVRYPGFSSKPLGCTGSVAHFFAEEFLGVVGEKGGRVDCILHHPIDKLVNYHFTQK
jgi:glucosamine kinase